jgi:hypothetical protein
VWQKSNLATLCTNRQRCCHPLHMAVRLTPAVDSIQVWTCYNYYAIVESAWSETVFVRRDFWQTKAFMWFLSRYCYTQTEVQMQGEASKHILWLFVANVRRTVIEGGQLYQNKSRVGSASYIPLPAALDDKFWGRNSALECVLQWQEQEQQWGKQICKTLVPVWWSLRHDTAISSTLFT